jgi:hypothetical protein
MTWRDAIKKEIGDQTGLDPVEVASILTETISALSVFCDLLAHVAMNLEGDVDIERARRYKTNAFAAHDELVGALVDASSMNVAQVQTLVATTISLAASLWQVSHPTPTLAALYEQIPSWGHVALDFKPRLTLILQATALGLAQMAADSREA